MRAKRMALSDQDRLVASANLKKHLQLHPQIKNAQNIAAYMAFNNEIDPMSWIKEIYQIKECYLPVINSPLKQMQFALYNANTVLQPNQYGILEPVNEQPIYYPSQKLEIVLVPLIAFDLKGNRVGTGAGYYDRTFSFLNKANHRNQPKLIGLAYEFQKIDHIEAEAWDVILDGVITEIKTYQFN